MSQAANDRPESLVADVISYAVGVVIGRWDACFTTGERVAPGLLDPFDRLPVCSPGMLQGKDIDR
jgi:hypothetical protein